MAENKYGLDTGRDAYDLFDENTRKAAARREAVKEADLEEANSYWRKGRAGFYGLSGAVKEFIGTALPEGETAKSFRIEAEKQNTAADIEREKAGFVESYQDINDVSDFASYATGLTLESIPYMVPVGGGILAGTSLAVRSGITGARALSAAGVAGGTAGGLPAKTGQYLKEQRDMFERETGRTASEGDFAAAFIPALASSFADVAFGAEGLLVRGAAQMLAKEAAKAGAKNVGRLGSAALTGARTAAEEAGTEFFDALAQEYVKAGISQKGYSMTGEEAFNNYKESAIGGAILGGIFGGVGGAVNPHSNSYKAYQEAQKRKRQEDLEREAASQAAIQAGVDDANAKIKADTEAARTAGKAQTRQDKAKAINKTLEQFNLEIPLDSDIVGPWEPRFKVSLKDRQTSLAINARVRQAVDALSEMQKKAISEDDKRSYVKGIEQAIPLFDMKIEQDITVAPKLLFKQNQDLERIIVQELDPQGKLKKLVGWEANVVKRFQDTINDRELSHQDKVAQLDSIIQEVEDSTRAITRPNKKGSEGKAPIDFVVDAKRVMRHGKLGKKLRDIGSAYVVLGDYVAMAHREAEAAYKANIADMARQGASEAEMIEVLDNQKEIDLLQGLRPPSRGIDPGVRDILDKSVEDPELNAIGAADQLAEDHLDRELEKNEGKYVKTLSKRMDRIQKAQDRMAEINRAVIARNVVAQPEVRKTEEGVREDQPRGPNYERNKKRRESKKRQRLNSTERRVVEARKYAQSQDRMAKARKAKEEPTDAEAQRLEADRLRVEAYEASGPEDTYKPEGKEFTIHRSKENKPQPGQYSQSAVRVGDDLFVNPRGHGPASEEAAKFFGITEDELAVWMNAGVKIDEGGVAEDAIVSTSGYVTEDGRYISREAAAEEDREARAAEETKTLKGKAKDKAIDQGILAPENKGAVESIEVNVDLVNEDGTPKTDLQKLEGELAKVAKGKGTKSKIPETIERKKNEEILDKAAERFNKALKDTDKGRAQPALDKPTNPQFTPQGVQRIMDTWSTRLKNGPRMVALDSREAQTGELKQAVDAAEELTGRDEQGRVNAVGHYIKLNGEPTVLIYTDNVVDRAQIDSVLYHESLGHHGLDVAFRAVKNSMYDDMLRVSPRMRELAKAELIKVGLLKNAVGEEVTQDTWRYGMEEVIVNLDEQYRQGNKDIASNFKNLLTRMNGVLRQFARKHTGLLNDKPYTDGEVLAIMATAKRSVINGPSGLGRVTQFGGEVSKSLKQLRKTEAKDIPRDVLKQAARQARENRRVQNKQRIAERQARLNESAAIAVDVGKANSAVVLARESLRRADFESFRGRKGITNLAREKIAARNAKAVDRLMDQAQKALVSAEAAEQRAQGTRDTKLKARAAQVVRMAKELVARINRLNPSKFSRRQGVGQPTGVVRDWVRAEMANWKKAPRVVVLDSRDAHPIPEIEYLRRRARALAGVDENGSVRAAGYHTARDDGTFNKSNILIFSDKINDKQHALETLWHEALGHAGLLRLFRDQLDAKLVQMYDSTPWLKDVIDARLGNYKENGPRGYSDAQIAEAVEEELAEAQEVVGPNASEIGFWRELGFWLRDFARRFFGDTVKIPYTQNEIVAILAAARKQVVGGDTILGVNNSPGVAGRSLAIDFLNDRFSRDRIEPDTQRSIDDMVIPETWQERGQSIRDTFSAAWTEKKYGALPFRDLVRKTVDMMPAAQEYFNAMMNTLRTENEMSRGLETVLTRADALSAPQRKTVESALYRMTVAKKWGYQPTWLVDDNGKQHNVDVDPTMEAIWNTLDDTQKAVADSALEHSYRTNIQLKKVLDNEFRRSVYGKPEGGFYTQAEFNALPKEERASRTQAHTRWKKFQGDKLRLGNQFEPYVPLMRFGDWIVTGRSAEFTALENQLKGTVGEARDSLAERLEEMKTEPEHYFVTFVENKGAAKLLESNLAKDPRTQNLSFSSFPKADMAKNIGAVPWKVMRDLRDQFRAGLDEKQDPRLAGVIDQLMSDLYVNMLAETSARKSLQERKGVAGATERVFRSLAHKGSADARFISSIQNGADLSSALSDMRKQADEVTDPADRENRRTILREMYRRHAQQMEPAGQLDNLYNKIMATSSFWHLLTAPRYYIQNLTQPYMITAPYMAGRFGTKGYSELYKAYGELRKFYMDNKQYKDFFSGDFDLAHLPASVTAEERTMLEEMKNRGLLDIGLAFEIGKWQRGDGSGLTAGMSDAAAKTMFYLTGATRQVEAINRVSSALAAYRLREGSADTKTKYAEEVLEKTQFDYSGLNAPRYFNMAPKVITQFRKYQVYQISLLYDMATKALRGDPEFAADPQAFADSKKFAAYSLAFTMGQAAAVTGALGLPAVSTAAYLLSGVLGDEDDPRNIEDRMREYIGDERTANFILKGATTAIGLDVSRSLGWQVDSVLPYTDINFRDQNSYYEAMATVAGGPAGAIGAGLWRGVGYMMDGDYWKGAEAMAPSGIRAASKTLREQGVMGVTTRSGNILATPEEFDLMDNILGTLGLQSTTQTRISRARDITYRYGQEFNRITAQLKKQMIEAQDNRDYATMNDLRERWLKLQDAKQKTLGQKRSPLSDLFGARKARRQSEQRARKELSASNRYLGGDEFAY